MRIKSLFSISVYVSFAMMLFTSCSNSIPNQSLSYVPEFRAIGKTNTGCEIYGSKEFEANTTYEDYAICISQIDNLETEFNVTIPQIVAKNQNQLTTVNEMLYNNGLLGSSLNDSDVQEFESHYGISFAEYNVVSIFQQGTCTTAMHSIEFANACTFDRDTDTSLTIDKYFDIKKLLDLYELGQLKIYMNQGYNDDTIKLLLQDYVDLCANDTNFFINQTSIFLIVPVSGTNTTYIIVEAARK